MLEDGHCLRDQAMGFCFQAGAREDTHFRGDKYGNPAQYGGGRQRYHVTAGPGDSAGAQTRRRVLPLLHQSGAFREVILVYRPAVAAAQPLQPAGRGYPCKNVCLLPAGACGLK